MSRPTEIHGWISIRYTYENSEAALDLSEKEMPFIVERIGRKIEELYFHSADVRVICSRGYYVNICGYRDNAGDYDSAMELFRHVGEVAKGSYGMLHRFDSDEDRTTVDVLRKGVITQYDDIYFSPFIPLVEDEASD